MNTLKITLLLSLAPSYIVCSLYKMHTESGYMQHPIDTIRCHAKEYAAFILFLENLNNKNDDIISDSINKTIRDATSMFKCPSLADSYNAYGQTALMIMLRNNNINDKTQIFIAGRLLEQSEYPLKRDKEDRTALDYTTNETIKSLIRERTFEKAPTTLDIASIKELLNMHSYNPNELFLKIFEEKSLGTYFPPQKILAASQFLLERGAAITPYHIHYALDKASDYLELFALLLQYGARPTKKQLLDAFNKKKNEYNQKGNYINPSVISVAKIINNGDYSTVPLDDDGNTVLMHMINQGRCDDIVNNDAFFSHTKKNLIFSTIRDDLFLRDDLFFSTVNDSINMQNNKGDTALTIAAKRKPFDSELFSMLIAHGASLHIRNNGGTNGLGLILDNNDREFFLFLAKNFSPHNNTTRSIWLTTHDDYTLAINYEQAEESTPLKLLLNNCERAGTKKRPINVNFTRSEVFEFIEALNTTTNAHTTPDIALRFKAPGLYARCIYQQLPNNRAIEIAQHYMPNLETIKQGLIMGIKFSRSNPLYAPQDPVKKRIHALNNLTVDKVLFLENMHEKIEHKKHLHVYSNTSNYYALQSLNQDEYKLFTEKLPLVIQDKYV